MSMLLYFPFTAKTRGILKKYFYYDFSLIKSLFAAIFLYNNMKKESFVKTLEKKSYKYYHKQVKLIVRIGKTDGFFKLVFSVYIFALNADTSAFYA